MIIQFAPDRDAFTLFAHPSCHTTGKISKRKSFASLEATPVNLGVGILRLYVILLIINKKMVQDSATGALVFNPSDYCPYTQTCLSFVPHERGNSGYKGVQSHLRKVHKDAIYYLIPCEYVRYLCKLLMMCIDIR
jgi:hypothetical protein